MNSGYNPMMFEPNKVAKVQAQSQQPPFYFGGSEVPSALGFTPTIKPIIKEPNVEKRLK